MKKILDIIALLDRSLKEDGATTVTSGGIIASGYDSDIDAYRDTIEASHRWLSEYQSRIIEQTGISNLKIKFTNASGYFIEVNKNNISKLSDEFVHKQTLVNAARFVTPELIEYQNKLFEAQDTLAEREYKIFQEIRQEVLEGYGEMKQIAKDTAFLDTVSSFASVTYTRNYTCPEMSPGYGLTILGGRHPVIESTQRDFIKNDLELTATDNIHVITGPNMGGKSTFLRQNALIILMAHMGCFVPADSAKIGITDKIFSRVGAHDNLFLGKSTFMVEMEEVAHILSNATKKSFIIIDEVGRGTSTYDGMSLAWGILEYIHTTLGSKTLFATHYHEIIDESVSLKGVTNYSVAVGENEENLVFLRKIIPGGIKKSYGLEVAKIAGIPRDILQEAKNMILRHQSPHGEQLSLETTLEVDTKKTPSELETYISELDINDLTPLKSLNILAKIKKLSEK